MKKQKKDKKKKRLRRPRLPQVIYVLFLIAAIIYVSNRGGAFSYTLFYAALAYPVLAFLYLLYMRATIRIDQALPVRELKKNMDQPYVLKIVNSGLLPSAGITIHTYKGRAVFGEELNGKTISLLPKAEIEWETALSCKYSGSYAAGISRLTFRDCFGLITMTLKTPAPMYVQVLPVVNPDHSEETAKALLNLNMGASGGRMKERENTLGNEIKPYIQGDPIKRIHWKNYARSGELFVRLPEEKDLQLVSVVLLARPVEGLEDETGDLAAGRLAERDRFLDEAASVAAYFAGQKRPVQFFFYNAGVKRMLVEDFEGLHSLGLELSKELVLRGDTAAVDTQVLAEAEHWNCPILTLKEEVTEENTR